VLVQVVSDGGAESYVASEFLVAGSRPWAVNGDIPVSIVERVEHKLVCYRVMNM
jgi:hypothetical protein